MFRTKRAVSIDKSKEKSGSFPIPDDTNHPPPPPPPLPDAPEFDTIPDSNVVTDTMVDDNDTTNSNNEDNNNNKDDSNDDEEDEEKKDVEEEKNEVEEEMETPLADFSEEIDQFISTISSSEPDDSSPPSCLEKYTKQAEAHIAKYESGAKVNHNTDEDSILFFDTIYRIYKLTSSLSQFPSQSECVTLVNLMSTVLQRAMLFLEEELKILITDFGCASDPDHPPPNNSKNHNKSESGENDRCILPQAADSTPSEEENYPGYSTETVVCLKRVANAMISAGYDKECSQIYSIARRNAFEERLNKLGFEKISMDDVQKMQWDSLEREIGTWIDVTKRSISIYFPGERKLCDQVFADYSSISSDLFSDLTRNVVNQLLIFAEAVGMTKRSAEKFFKFLDMYETLREFNPKMDGLLSEESGQDIRSETSSARCRLGEAAVGMFCDLENSIKSDMGKTPVPGGAVHPLTRYTMNYVKYACEYKETLEQVFQEHQKLDRSDSLPTSETETNTPTHYNKHNRSNSKPSPFSVQLVTVMDLLDSNLEAKSKLYKDISLSCIFLMNNGRYIMQKIKDSTEIYDLMGDTWCRKRSSDLRQYHKNYQRETWSKVLDCLKDQGLNVNGKVAKPVLKERFKSFNAMFDEIHKTQSAWIVSDEQLQSELRVSISAVVIPAYRSFLGRFRQYLDPGRQTEKYIKFGPEDVETYIDELFDGTPQSMARRRT